MMNITEEEGCRTIIGYLSDEEIFVLLDTVTKKQIKATGREEAIDAIISYTDSAEQFLQRQKIKREMIFKYLHSEKVQVSASSNKKMMISEALKAWENKDSRFMEMDDEEEENNENHCEETEVPVNVKQGRKGRPGRKPGKKGSLAKSPIKDETVVKTANSSATETIKDTSMDNPPTTAVARIEGDQMKSLQEQTLTLQTQTNIQHPPTPQTNIQQDQVANTLQSATSEALQYVGQQTTHSLPQTNGQNGLGISPLLPQINVHVHINQFTNSPAPTPMGPGDMNFGSRGHMVHPGSGERPQQDMGAMNLEVQGLGEKFVKWFYDNLNSFNPSCVLNMQDFGPQHFWDDVHLEVEMYTPHLNNETMDGPLLVSQRLLAFTKDDTLLFNPNISGDGVFVKSSPHGLVKIMACGSVHRGNACLGIFQQAFGIIRDPRFDNNWKIKYIKLQLKTGEVLTLPKLEGDVESQIHALVPL